MISEPYTRKGSSRRIARSSSGITWSTLILARGLGTGTGPWLIPSGHASLVDAKNSRPVDLVRQRDVNSADRARRTVRSDVGKIGGITGQSVTQDTGQGGSHHVHVPPDLGMGRSWDRGWAAHLVSGSREDAIV